MKMSDINVGMRLVSSKYGDPFSPITVTEITTAGFRYQLDAVISLIPRWGMFIGAEGHEHFGIDGETYYEVAK